MAMADPDQPFRASIDERAYGHLQIENGHVSELIGLPHRADRSELNAKLRALEPGDRIAIETPAGMTVAAFRSTILTAGRRMSFGDWKLSTRSQGRKIHCFLAPV
jgi:hypothetical protein